MSTTQIEKNSVVSLNYILRDKEGQIIDQTQQGEPLLYLHGHQNIIPGLEKELEALKVGDKKKVHVPAADAYGEFDQEKCFGIERSSLPDAQLEPGMVLELTPDDGEGFLARIVQIADDHVDVDANHPMAGKDLFFEVEIVALRAASAEEVAHGHVHGPDGHHHHH
jgi:FKBP-type peptidyl-prolyl cis-trans isomerase SlyD